VRQSGRALRTAAVVAAVSVVSLAMAAGGGPVDPAAASAVAAADGASTAGNDALNVTVGKVVDASTDAAGQAWAQGLYTATNLAGPGTATVTVPIGTDNPVSMNSFTKLQTAGQSIVYSIQNSPGQVQTLIASGGKFTGDLPVTFTTELLVDGKAVDPNTATSITGDVELNYKFVNHTAHTEPITFKDVSGNLQTKDVLIAIPFSVAFDNTFGNGWADLVAPWANSGFSMGQIITGSTTLMPSPLNGMNPNGTLTIKGKAQNASLPTASISIVPKSTSGSTTAALGKATQAGTQLEDLLAGKALPLLTEAVSGLGKASNGIATLLDKKINPLLSVLERVHLNPNKADAALATGGKVLRGLGDSVFGINSATEQLTAAAAATGAAATSAVNQQKLINLLAKIDAIQQKLDPIVPKLGDISMELKIAGAALAVSLPAQYCPGQTECTVGEFLDRIQVQKVKNSCSTDGNTMNAWDNQGGATALGDAINSSAVSSKTKDRLRTLQNLLEAQARVPHTASDISSCLAAANSIAVADDGVFGELGLMGNSLHELIPLLDAVYKGLPAAKVALTRLIDAMPAINKALDSPCSAVSVTDNLAGCGLLQDMRLVVAANKSATTALNEDVLRLIAMLEGPVNNLFSIVNGLADAAPGLKKELDALPALIMQVANGNVGSLVPTVQSLTELAASLTNVASEQVEINKAIDVHFNAGEAFPYGSASGGGAATSAQYKFKVAAAETGGASMAMTVIFALVMLLLALAAAIWAQLRKRS